MTKPKKIEIIEKNPETAEAELSRNKYRVNAITYSAIAKVNNTVKEIIIKQSINDANLVKREGHALAELNHPGIIQLYGTKDREIKGRKIRELYLEKADGPCFLKLIKNRKIKDSNLITKLKLIYLVAQTLEYLHHEKNMSHGDLKPEHIILTDNPMQTKIIDFEDAQKLTRPQNLGVERFTPKYASPERMGKLGMKYDPSKDDKSDIYSLGVIAWMLATNQHPYLKSFGDKEQNFKLGKIENMTTRIKTIDDLFKACVSLDPNNRPTARKLVNQLNYYLRKK